MTLKNGLSDQIKQLQAELEAKDGELSVAKLHLDARRLADSGASFSANKKWIEYAQETDVIINGLKAEIERLKIENGNISRDFDDYKRSREECLDYARAEIERLKEEVALQKSTIDHLKNNVPF